jgi:DNA-binding NarL/FixJ family response regulator
MLQPEEALSIASRVVETTVSGAREPFERLSAREQEVARLVARGLTNPEIAAKLIIGERTVQTHVSNILSKSRLGSRVQVASWLVEYDTANAHSDDPHRVANFPAKVVVDPR